MTTIRGAIFDVDGTLIDSIEAHAAAWQAILAEERVRTSWGEIIGSIGLVGEKQVPKLTGAMKNSEKGSRLSGHRDLLFRQRYLPLLQVFPKARELLEMSRAHGLKMAAISLVQAEEVRGLLVRTGLAPFFETEISSEGAPSGASVSAALKRLGMSASEVLMVGGTPYDIEAASLVGVRTVAFRCGGWGDTELGGAVAIYDDPQDLFEHFEASALAVGVRDSEKDPLLRRAC